MVEHDWYEKKKKNTHKTALSGEARQVPIKFPLKIKRFTLYSPWYQDFFFFSVAKLYFTENYFDPLLIWAVRGL